MEEGKRGGKEGRGRRRKRTEGDEEGDQETNREEEEWNCKGTEKCDAPSQPTPHVHKCATYPTHARVCNLPHTCMSVQPPPHMPVYALLLS